MPRNTTVTEDTHPNERTPDATETDNPFLSAYSKKNNVDLFAVREHMDTLRPSRLLKGTWGHMSFFYAVVSELEHDKEHYHLKTAFYDFEKSVGGDGMSTGPLDKRNINTVMNTDTHNREIVAMRVSMSTTEDVAKFANMINKWNWAVEWGIDQTGNVWVAPSDVLDYEAEMSDIYFSL